jgi:hypothetical protein
LAFQLAAIAIAVPYAVDGWMWARLPQKFAVGHCKLAFSRRRGKVRISRSCAISHNPSDFARTRRDASRHDTATQ